MAISKRSANTNIKASGTQRADPRQRALAWLRDHGSPRFVMSLMLASTIGCGFITSITLHRVGLSAPIVRYPVAVLAGWAAFLALVSVWVWWLRRENVRADERTGAARNSVRGDDSPLGWSGGEGSGGARSSSRSRGPSLGGGGGRLRGGGAVVRADRLRKAQWMTCPVALCLVAPAAEERAATGALTSTEMASL